jgi:hypothetical protein
MKEIKRYVADDGTEFIDATACRMHEAYVEHIGIATRGLPARPENIEFTNGRGYVQHEPEALLQSAWRAVCRIAASHHGPDFADAPFRSQRVIRTLWEATPAEFAFVHRITCLDEQYREWGQPFFALNPDNAESICLNPTGVEHE